MIISYNGIKLQSHISEKICTFKNRLNTKEEIQKFLGCLNYAGEFITELAKKRNSLQKLLRKSNTTGWTEAHTEIVKTLKEECKNLSKLRLPEPEDKLVLQTDASDLYWAAVLKTNLNEICKYCSGTFNQAEINYSTCEKELLAIIRGIKKFILFLFERML